MFRLNSKPKIIVLCILDGWGVSQDDPGNAITQAQPSCFNELWFSYPHTILVANGQAVGLPEGQVGNSEVGHINLGAGRIVFQDLLRINTAIADGTFYQNQAFLNAIDHIIKNNSNVHLMGLVGYGAVHSDIAHLYAILQILKKSQIPQSRIKLHLFTDGRDSPPASAKIYLSEMLSKISSGELGQVASISGRYYAMDRDNRWDRTAKAYDAILGKSPSKSTNVLDVVEKSYAQNITDEFIVPTTIVDESQIPIGPIHQNDAAIFFNYRPDRARQLSKAFVLDNVATLKTNFGETVKGFNRGPKIKNLFFISMTNYERHLPVTMVAFPPEEITMPIARVFAEMNAKQLHIAETEKYAHVTYFFNGGRELPYPGEDRILVDSPKVASYDLVPQMSAPEITSQLINHISSGGYDFVVMNYANADMVSHTGNVKATILSVKTIDNQLKLLSRQILQMGGCLIITADHGNAEEMINLRTGEKDTEHNPSPVPFILAYPELRGINTQLPQGLLADVAPTILSLAKIPKPSQMTGRSLL